MCLRRNPTCFESNEHLEASRRAAEHVGSMPANYFAEELGYPPWLHNSSSQIVLSVVGSDCGKAFNENDFLNFISTCCCVKHLRDFCTSQDCMRATALLTTRCCDRLKHIETQNMAICPLGCQSKPPETGSPRRAGIPRRRKLQLRPRWQGKWTRQPQNCTAWRKSSLIRCMRQSPG